jgi:outer membrane receptor for ferric coprogen and ferric-rhodotorulic acid
LSVNNLLDRRYYQTVDATAGGNWYGEPRNFMLRLDGRY